jgi:hypothetical protein
VGLDVPDALSPPPNLRRTCTPDPWFAWGVARFAIYLMSGMSRSASGTRLSSARQRYKIGNAVLHE